jgi:hypothetical protein
MEIIHREDSIGGGGEQHRNLSPAIPEQTLCILRIRRGIDFVCYITCLSSLQSSPHAMRYPDQSTSICLMHNCICFVQFKASCQLLQGILGCLSSYVVDPDPDPNPDLILCQSNSSRVKNRSTSLI